MYARKQVAIRRVGAILVAGTILLAASCQPAAKPDPSDPSPGLDRDTAQNLRGPGPEAGSVYLTESTTTMTGGTLTVDLGGTTQSAGLDMTTRFESEETVVDVSDNRKTRVRTRVIRDEVTDTLRADSQTETKTEAGPLVGETIESEWAVDRWTQQLVEKAPTAR